MMRYLSAVISKPTPIPITLIPTQAEGHGSGLATICFLTWKKVQSQRNEKLTLLLKRLTRISVVSAQARRRVFPLLGAEKSSSVKAISSLGRAPKSHTLVESRMGAVAWGLWPTPRFPSPLIEPDVPISGIRLSDWLHREAHDGAARWQAFETQQAAFSVDTSQENRWVPRPATLCRLARKSRTRS